MSPMVTASRLGTLLMLAGLLGRAGLAAAETYPVVDTGQTSCYDASAEIAAPAAGDPFHGQDAQYDVNQPSYTVSGDGLTVYDNVTGLTWMVSPDADLDGVLESPQDKLSFWDALDFPATLNAQSYGGYDDWRLPSIKELYSLILFSGVDPSGFTGDTSGLIPFIDTDVFDFVYGDESAGERIIDSQYWSSDAYVGTTMGGDHTVFGVNFADGRIKGYGTTLMGSDKTSFVLCCRGNAVYGVNDFAANGDGTVTDAATGLMWMQDDSGAGMTWEDALAYAEGLDFAGHDDWRLPNAKELQGILDYTRSPQTTGTAAVDTVFTCSAISDEDGGSDFPFYWSGTTHSNWTDAPGAFGAYVAFGSGYGWMQDPFPPFDYTFMDVHGAGCQRSDPKDGDPADYPYGNGPQGDVVRIYNHVRCVRDAGTNVGVEDDGEDGEEVPEVLPGWSLKAVPNPFNPQTTIRFSVQEPGPVTVMILDVAGRLVTELVSESLPVGEHEIAWNGLTDRGQKAPSGVYLARLVHTRGVMTVKVTLSK